MQEELNQIEKNKVWELVQGKQLIPPSAQNKYTETR